MKTPPKPLNVFVVLWTDKGNVQIPARRFIPKVEHVKVKTYKLP